MRLSSGNLNALLERWPVGRLATITPAGLPHVLPVVFVGDPERECIWSPVDAKRKRSHRLARVRNVAAHGRASLLLDHYGDWTELWWVRLDCAAAVAHPHGGDLARLAERLRAKYPQYRTLEPFTAEPTALRLTVERVTAWSQSGTADPIERTLAAP